MEQSIDLDVLPKDGARCVTEVKAGNLVVARSGSDFLYMIVSGGLLHMFSHTAGAPGGGKKQFPLNERYEATIRKVIELADSVYVAEYSSDMNIYAVMSTAEEAILSTFPGEDTDNNETVDFMGSDS